MRMIILFFSLLISSLHALQPTVIHTPTFTIDNFTVEHYVDTTQVLDFDDIRNKNFTQGKNGISLGTNAKHAWSRMHITNQNDTPITVYVHHTKAYHNKVVGFYETHNGTLLHKQIIDLDTQKGQNSLYGAHAIYLLNIDANQTKTLYVHNISFSHQWFKLALYDAQGSKRALVNSNNDIALLVGALLALVFYNFLLYFSSNNKANIYYSLYLISGTVWIALSYGFFATLIGVYGSIALPFHLSLILMPIFLLLFMTQIFNTKKHYPKEHTVLLALIFTLGALALYGVFDIISALKPASTLAAVMMLVTLSVSISLFIKKNPLAKYFIIGHSFFIFFNLYAVLFYKGYIDFNYISSHGVGIGIVLEGLMLAFIIAYRMKLLEDIQKEQEELKFLASTDSLTKLFNRRHFFTQADFALTLVKKHNQSACVAVIDIDHFKTINDTYGHKMGDDVLVDLAKLMQDHFGDESILCRFGGEEFVVLLPNTSSSDAYTALEQFRLNAAQITHTSQEHTQSIRITISIGLTTISTQNETIEEAIHRADTALYRAKNNGRNQVCSA